MCQGALNMFARSLIIALLFAGCSHPATKIDTDLEESVGREPASDIFGGKVDPIGDGSPIDWRKNTMAAFCRENLRVGMAEASFDLSEKELQAQLKAGTLEIEDAPWMPSLYPDERSILANHNRQYFFKPPQGGFEGDHTTLELLNGIEDGSANDKKEWPKSVDAAIRKQDSLMKVKSGRDQDNDLKQAEKEFRPLCSYYSAWGWKDCVEALKKAIDMMTPIEDVSLFPLIKEVIADPVYGEAAMTLAKTIETKIVAGKVPSGNLLDDTVAAFEAHRISHDDAVERAFKLLAMYSTNGPNTSSFLERFISEANRKLYYGLGVVGTGIPLLTWRSQASGHAYAFPPSVHATCQNGKPYHFWLAAYLARETGRAMKNSAAGRQAAYLGEVGYQMKATTASRDPNRAFMNKMFEPGNNKIRMDLAWGAAGAAFGASTLDKDDGTTYDVDASLKEILESGFVFPAVSKDEAEKLWSGSGAKGFARWSVMFRPKLALKKVRVSAH
jgi:hypothetical protein